MKSNQRRRLNPMVEQCERRALLSGGLATAPAAIVAETRRIEKVVQLDGMFQGKYRRHLGNPEAGSVFVFMGSGQVSGLGRVAVIGKIQAVGMIAYGHAEGTLILSNARGTVALSLSGILQQGGGDALPSVFGFGVNGGTGKYRGFRGAGVADLAMTPARSASGVVKPNHGTFTFTLTAESAPPP